MDRFLFMQACDLKTKATLRSVLGRASKLGEGIVLCFTRRPPGVGMHWTDRSSEPSDSDGSLLSFPGLYFWT